ncbi:hypothetical protein LT330_010122 [Penicillium expansum]|nr:hypothetical protein LT330_010674 [Penicillium expansum]KAK4864093.1 hypothetical protein LT330_010122 [Penicillium expansum]
MPLSNPAPLEPKTIPTIQTACKLLGYLHASPQWSLRFTPDEVDLIYFIVVNYPEPGEISTSSSGVSIPIPRDLASTQFPFPKSWLTCKGRARKAAKVFLVDAKRIFMTDAFHNWKKQAFTTSILDLPNEVLHLIAALLPTNSLVILCQLNRRLSSVAGFELWRPLDRALEALEWSLNHRRLTVYEKAVQELSKIPESMGNESTWKLFPMIDTDNIHMLECMALKDGFIGKMYRQFLVDTLSDNLEWSKRRHLSVGKVLKLGADPNCFSHNMAVERTHFGSYRAPCKSTINALLRAPGIDLDPRDENGRTPLSIAVGVHSKVSAWFVKSVLKSPNVDINSQDIHGKTVLYHSVESRNIEVANLLLSQSHIDPNLNTMRLPLFFAVSNRMTSMVKSLLSTKATDPNRRDSNGRLALTLPTSKAIIKLLIKAGAELDIRDSTGLTARETISQAGINPEQLIRWTHKKHQVKKAIEKTVDLASPLLERSWRSQLGAKSILDLPVELMWLIERELSDSELYNLCQANGDLYHILSGRLCWRDGSSWICSTIKSSKPLHGHELDVEDETQEREERAYRHVKLLLAHGADPNSVGSPTEMASTLHLACLYNQPKIVQALLEAGADPNAKDSRGCTPLHMLFEPSVLNTSYQDILLDILLADPRVKIDERDNNGSTPLQAAATCRYNRSAALRCAKKFVRMPDEVDINSQDGEGRTPLWDCIAINQYDMTRLLLAQDRLDPNLGPADAFPLLLAVDLNQQLTVEHLLESKRVDVNKQTSTGQTALLKAIDVGNKEVIKMLAKAGANPDIGMSKGRTARQQILAAGIRVKWKTRPV